MKRLKILPAILLILLLSGCMGAEPNDIAYVVAMGFDKADNDNYKITIQFAKPNQISGGASEEGGSGKEIVENVAVEAPNIYSAINIANNIVSKKFSLSHAKLMVFSQEVAEEGLEDLMETFIRSYEIRPDMYLAVAPDGAEDYLSEVKPVVEVNPAKYYQLTYEQRGGAGIPKNTALDFYFCRNRLYRDGVLPVAGVLETKGGSEGGGSQGGSEGGSGGGQEGEGSSEGGSGEESSQKAQGGTSEESGGGSENEAQKSAPINEKGFEFKIKNYIAGEVAIRENNKSEAMGMAVFKENKMVGTLGSIESEVYNLMTGNYDYGYISFYSDKSGGTPVTVRLQQRKKPKIDVDVKKKKIDIRLYMESDLYSLPADYVTENDIGDFEEISKEAIKSYCGEFLNKTLKEYNVDVLGLARSAKKDFLTYQEFSEHNWSSEFKDYDININTEFYVRRSGMTMRSE